MENSEINKFGAKVVSEATQSFLNFADEIEQTELLMFFLLEGGKHISEDKASAKNSLASMHRDNDNPVSQKFIDHINSEKADPLFDTFFYERHFSQMTYARSIDNFITYFKEILAEIVNKRPEVLRSKDQEKLDFILSFESMQELLKALSEKKIEELFFKGISDIEKFFKERLGVDFFKEELVRKNTNRLIKQRNLIVHNRGRVSKEFVREFPESGFTENLYLAFTYKGISNLNLILYNYVVDLDREIVKKFNLDLVKRG